MILSGAEVIVRLSPALTVVLFESVTVTLTVNVPTLVGVPVIAPVADEILSPSGSPEADQVYGGEPPVAARLTE